MTERDKISAPRSDRRRRGRPAALWLGAIAAIATVWVAVHPGVFAAPRARAAGAGLELSGTALDEAGAPIAGCKAELLPVPPRYENGRRILAGPLRPDPVATVKCSRDGGYRLTAPEPGMWQVEISAPGRIPLRHRLVPLIADRELPPATLERDGGAWIAVVVGDGDGDGDGDGEPVAGALVWMRPRVDPEARRRWVPREWRPRGRFARADEAGNVYLSRRRGQPIEVFAYAAGFLPSASVEVAGDRGRVQLIRGRPLAMRFTTAAGEPAAQAVVGVGELQWLSSLTDAAGEAVIHVAPGQPLPFALHLPSGQRESGTLEAAAEDLERSPGPVEEMTLPPPLVVSGRVLDAMTREPAVGAWVWSAADPGRVERAGPDGDYRVVESSAGYWQIGATAPGYQPASERAVDEGRRERGPTILLRRLAVIAGRVIDSSGSTVAAAEIVASEKGDLRRLPGSAARATSDDTGRFRLTGLGASSTYDLRVDAAGFSPALVSARSGDGSPGEEVEIVLERGRALIGRLVSEEGEAVAGASVAVSADHATRWGLSPGLREPDASASGSDGLFRFDNLPRSSALLIVRHPDFAPKQQPLVDFVGAFEDAAGAPFDLGEVVLRRGGRLAGVVLDETRRPVEGARVRLLGSSPMAFLSLPGAPADAPAPASDAEGRFALEGLSSGDEASLMVEHSDYLRRTVDGLVVGAEERLEIVLERGATVSGRVEDEARRPVAGAVVSARPLGGGQGLLTAPFTDMSTQESGTSEADGTFALKRVKPGAVELAASGGGYVSVAAVEITVESGERREGVVLRVRRGWVVEGTVRDSARRPVDGAILQLVESRSSGLMHVTRPGASGHSDSEGRYRIEGVSPRASSLRLEVHHPDFPPFIRELEVTGPSNRLDVILERGHAVSGVILTPDGDPAAGASVGLDGGSGVYFGGRDTTITAVDGSFEIVGVGPGIYRLFAMKDGFARTVSPTPVEIADRSVSALLLRLTRGGTIRGRILGLEPEELGAVGVAANDLDAQSATGHVGDDGEYGVFNVGFGQGTVNAWLMNEGRFASEAFELDPDGGETWVDLEFPARSGSTLSGAVRLDGVPWRGVRVLAQGGVQSQGGAMTDGSGRFRIEGLSDGPHRLALLSDVVLAHSELVEVRGDTEVDLDIATVEVRGRVITLEGRQPVAKATVSAEGSAPSWLGMAPARTETNLAGEFVLVLPAERRLTLRAAGAGRSEAALEIDTGPGPPITGIELELDLGDDLEVEVSAATEFPPTWVDAVVVDEAGRRLAAESARGLIRNPIRIRSVPRGSWTLRVAAEGCAPLALPVQVPGPLLSVTLSPESRLTVSLADGLAAIGNAELRVLTADGKPQALYLNGQRVDAWPVFGMSSELGALPAGDWILELTDDRGQVWRQTVTTTAGETVAVHFE